MEAEKFCLRWNDFETNISAGLRELKNEKDFFDVTLACDDSQIQAHKFILSACSPFFRNILRRNPHQHPLLYLKGVKCTELQSVMNFMYHGEVSVAQEELNTFLAVAEDLKVKGLTQNSPGEGSAKNNSKSEAYKQNNKPRLPQAIEGPKRARIVEHTPPPPPAEDYHQEVVLVKSEPGVTDEQAVAQHGGTVAVDQSYSEAGYEEYQYEEGYQDMPSMPVVGGQAAGFGSSADLESAIHAKMSKNSEGEWQCNDCYKTSKVKTNIFEHIEAAHVESPGYQCEICYKIYRTRSSFRKHKNVNHKDQDNVQLQF